MPYLYSYLAISIEGTSLSNTESKVLEHPAIGGLVLFTRNIETPEQVTTLISSIRRIKPNMVIMVDNEGLEDPEVFQTRAGVWRMVDNQGLPNPLFPAPPISQYRISQIYQENPQEGLQAAFNAGRQIKDQLEAWRVMALGVTLCSNPENRGPYPNPHRTDIQTVVDDAPGKESSATEAAFNTQEEELSQRLSTGCQIPEKTGWVIRGLGRSFGESPLKQIYPLAKAKLEGMQGMPTNVKHAVDHGCSSADSHVEKSLDGRNEEDLFKHLAIYKKLSEDGLVDSIMTSHVVHPLSKDPEVEFGLSAYWLEMLRNHVGPKPFIMSDCLSMGAIKESKAIKKKQHTKQGNKDVDYLVEAIACASNPEKYRKDGYFPGDIGVHTDLVLVCNKPIKVIKEILQVMTFIPDRSVKERLSNVQLWSEKKLSKKKVGP